MLVFSVVVFLFSLIQNKNFCIQKKAPHSTTTTQTKKQKKPTHHRRVDGNPKTRTETDCCAEGRGGEGERWQ
jgi:hypothetical protein